MENVETATPLPSDHSGTTVGGDIKEIFVVATIRRVVGLATADPAVCYQIETKCGRTVKVFRYTKSSETDNNFYEVVVSEVGSQILDRFYSGVEGSDAEKVYLSYASAWRKSLSSLLRGKLVIKLP